MSAPDAAIYVYPEDSGASEMAARTLDVLQRAAAERGYRPAADPRAGELLDRAPEDLLHAASSLASARAALHEAQDDLGRVRFDAAQEALLRANASLLDAAAAPSYPLMRDVHLYLGVLLHTQGQTESALAQFRTVLFFSPSFQLNRNAYPPSVVATFEQARTSIASRPKGSLRVEADKAGALVLVDGALKGAIPRIITDLPEGTHYLEVRSPGAQSELLTVQVMANQETPVLATIRPAAPPLRRSWNEPAGERGAAAIARILDVDRLVYASVRSTVAGVSPFEARGAAFDTTHRMTTAEIATSRELVTTDARLAKFAKELFRAPQAHAEATSQAAISALRRRFLAPYELRVVAEAGGAYQDHDFNDKGTWTPSTDTTQLFGAQPQHGFTHYTEVRTVLHLRYGLRERTTLYLDVPFYAKELTYDYDADNSGVIDPNEVGIVRRDQGVGDIVAGADVRVPSLEGVFSLVYVTTKVKLPTGSTNAGAPGEPQFGWGPANSLHQYHHLIMGTGEPDLYGGLGGVLAGGAARLEVEAGYLGRFGAPLPYMPNPNRVIKIGDEEHFRIVGALQMGRWVSLEAGGDATHRSAMKYFWNPYAVESDPGNTDPVGTPDMSMVLATAALRAEFSERTDAGFVAEYPVYGKATLTLFPVDVTGPRAWLYYGVRF